jgi:hypothetical protein
MTSPNVNLEIPPDEKSFAEFRRKVRSAEILSSAIERLLRALQFTGRLSVVVQNGRVLKSGYEEGYFTQRERNPQFCSEHSSPGRPAA